MNPIRIIALAFTFLSLGAGGAFCLEESISLVPIESNLFHHNEPTYTRFRYDFDKNGLVSLKGSFSATASGGSGPGAWVSLTSGLQKGSRALRYAWDLRGGHTRTRLDLVPGRFSRIRLAPGDGIFFHARSTGKELDNYPTRYVLSLEVQDGQNRLFRFITDYFEVEGIWGTYYVPLERFADVTHRAIGIFAASPGPHRLTKISLLPVTNKCRTSEIHIDTLAVYTTGPPVAGDRDGDGIPDELDGDDNNNGILDFAEKSKSAMTCPLEGYVLYGGRWKGRFHFPNRRPRYGDTLVVEAHLEIESEILARAVDAFPEFEAVLVGERLFDDQGRFGQFSDHMISTLLTPTGLPIENIQPGIPTRHFPAIGGTRVTSPIDLLARVRTSDITVEGKVIKMSFRFEKLIDYEVPEGYYRFQFTMGVRDNRGTFHRFEELPSVIRAEAGMAQDDHFRMYVQPEESLVFVRKNYLPLIPVGAPAATPRLPWSLLFHIEAHGVRGLVPEEEKGRWALNFRNRLGGGPIYRPGRYNLEPGLPSLVYERLNIHHRMNYRAGQMRVIVKDPDGACYDLGSAGFRTPTRWGVSTRTGKFLFPFEKYGQYEVTMDGYIYDAWGNLYRGGGTYVLWIARRITFGTSPSMPYEVGQVFHGAVEVVPAIPAHITITVEHYPYSDPRRKETFVTGRKANPYGLFVPKESYRFKEPGEYFAHIEGTYRDPKGRLWKGSLYGACVVAPKNAVLVAHGRGYYMANGQVLRDDARYNLQSEGDLANNIEQYLFYPYHSGDVMYVASTMDFKNEIYPLMTMEFLPVCRRCGTADYVFDPARKKTVCARCRGADFVRPLPYGGAGRFDHTQIPIFSVAKNDWSPHNFPEKLTHLCYFYTDAWRPGVNGRHLVGEGQMMNSYWPTSPSILGNQMHTGHNGDLPGDFYKFSGGVVYRDLVTGVNRYAIYSSMAVVIPKGSNANRVVEFGKEPLFNLLGRDHYIFLGGGVLPVPGLVLGQGGRVPAAGAANPPVPATLKTEIKSPSGRVWRYQMQANHIGIFPRKKENTTPLEEPGVWMARQDISYKGRRGDVLGSGDGQYPFYVLPKDPSRVTNLSIDQPPFFTFNPLEELRITGSAPPHIVEGTIHYTTITPGLILDYGTRKLVSGRFLYKFSHREMSYCYPFIDTVNFMTGKPQLADTIIITLFLEGRDKDGKTHYGVRMITLRGNRVINIPPVH